MLPSTYKFALISTNYPLRTQESPPTPKDINTATKKPLVITATQLNLTSWQAEIIWQKQFTVSWLWLKQRWDINLCCLKYGSGLTCHSSRYYRSNHRSFCPLIDTSQTPEQEPVFCHGVNDSRHWKHGPKQASKRQRQKLLLIHFLYILASANTAQKHSSKMVFISALRNVHSLQNANNLQYRHPKPG